MSEPTFGDCKVVEDQMQFSPVSADVWVVVLLLAGFAWEANSQHLQLEIATVPPLNLGAMPSYSGVMQLK